MMKWEKYSTMTVIQAGYGHTFYVTEARCSNCKKFSSKIWAYPSTNYEYCPHCGERNDEYSQTS